MSVQIFRDVEEALARQVRRITFDDKRTLTRTVLQDVFDPITGQIIKTPIQPSFYDSSVDAENIQYPNFFIKLLRTREDRFSKREVPLYGHLDTQQILTSPKVYEIVLQAADGVISAPGNTLTTSVFNLNTIQPGYLLRILNGNNIGTYIIESIDSLTNTITLSSTLIDNLPSIYFDYVKNTILFTSPQDLHTVELGDQFVDSTNQVFNINYINYDKGLFTVASSLKPSLLSGGSIQRVGNTLKNTDSSPLRFLIMNPAAPIEVETLQGDQAGTSEVLAFNWPVPLDAYFLVRIDSKEQEQHIDIINRIWEEFNPPRTGLPIVVRSRISADEFLEEDIPPNGSNTIKVKDVKVFKPGDKIYIIDDFTPTQDIYGFIREPFTSEVISINSNNQLILADIVPDTFKVRNNTKVVSNAHFHIWLFHFADHNTKDVESAQYWVHEFTFLVQVWVDRLGIPKEYGRVTDIATPVGIIGEEILIEDN